MYVILCVPNGWRYRLSTCILFCVCQRTRDADYPHVYYSVCANWLEMQIIHMYVILCVPNGWRCRLSTCILFCLCQTTGYMFINKFQTTPHKDHYIFDSRCAKPPVIWKMNIILCAQPLATQCMLIVCQTDYGHVYYSVFAKQLETQTMAFTGSIPLNSPGVRFYQFWTEVSVSIKIALYIFVWEQGSYNQTNWCMFYTYICLYIKITGNFIWSALTRKMDYLFAVNLHVNSNGRP